MNPLGGYLLVSLVLIALVAIVSHYRHGRTVVLDHPRPCSHDEAQRELDRLVAAGIDAEIVDADDSGLRRWANNRGGSDGEPSGRCVIRVPRSQLSRVTAL